MVLTNLILLTEQLVLLSGSKDEKLYPNGVKKAFFPKIYLDRSAAVFFAAKFAWLTTSGYSTPRPQFVIRWSSSSLLYMLSNLDSFTKKF